MSLLAGLEDAHKYISSHDWQNPAHNQMHLPSLGSTVMGLYFLFTMIAYAIYNQIIIVQKGQNKK